MFNIPCQGGAGGGEGTRGLSIQSQSLDLTIPPHSWHYKDGLKLELESDLDFQEVNDIHLIFYADWKSVPQQGETES